MSSITRWHHAKNIRVFFILTVMFNFPYVCVRFCLQRFSFVLIRNLCTAWIISKLWYKNLSKVDRLSYCDFRLLYSFYELCVNLSTRLRFIIAHLTKESGDLISTAISFLIQSRIEKHFEKKKSTTAIIASSSYFCSTCRLHRRSDNTVLCYYKVWLKTIIPILPTMSIRVWQIESV